MNLRKNEKLKTLLNALPEGVAVPSAWLTAQGYTPQLVRSYVQSGWLSALGNRAYALPGTDVGWEGVLLGLQRLGGLRLHLGGESALEHQGFAHYLRLGEGAVIHVWGQDRAPAWVSRLEGKGQWVLHRRRLFSDDLKGGWRDLPTGVRDWTLRASAPERAILEVLSEVGEDAASFTHAAELFEGLTTARPVVVEGLLKACTHSKAKRLFLFLADHYRHAWLKSVDVGVLDLGKGKRMVTRGGRFDNRYRITVPEAFHAE